MERRRLAGEHVRDPMIASLISDLIQEHCARDPARTPVIGVAGAQGSGKTYICRQLAAANPRIAHFALDDVYFTHAERQRLARQFHPLFATRGPPGTHAVGLALTTIAELRNASAETETPLPRFDKARDDRAPTETWPRFKGRPEAILFDGWCLGALPDEVGDAPINKLETEEDRDGSWRARIRNDLATRYQMFFAGFDSLIYLKPPGWGVVRRWRAQQEQETLSRELTPDDHARLDRFLMHYERLTRSMMSGAHCADVVAALDEGRRVTAIEPAR